MKFHIYWKEPFEELWHKVEADAVEAVEKFLTDNLGSDKQVQVTMPVTHTVTPIVELGKPGDVPDAPAPAADTGTPTTTTPDPAAGNTAPDPAAGAGPTGQE